MVGAERSGQWLVSRVSCRQVHGMVVESQVAGGDISASYRHLDMTLQSLLDGLDAFTDFFFGKHSLTSENRK